MYDYLFIFAGVGGACVCVCVCLPVCLCVFSPFKAGHLRFIFQENNGVRVFVRASLRVFVRASPRVTSRQTCYRHARSPAAISLERGAVLLSLLAKRLEVT